MTPILSSNQWRTVSLVFGIAILARALMFYGIDLYPDEAYYRLWSQHLAPGYFDNAPLVAWLAAPVSGISGELGFRLLFVILGALPIVFAALIAHELTDNEKAPEMAAVFCAVAPTLMLAGSLALTDAPHIAFYSAATWLFVRASGKTWLLVGLFWGLSLLAKWNSFLLAPSVILAAFFDRTLRRELSTPWPYFGALIGGAVFSPFVLWNWHHDWITFRFQFSHATRSQSSIWLKSAASYVAAVIIGAGPVVLFSAPAFSASQWRGTQRAASWTRLACATVFPFCVMGYLSITGKVEHNWPALFYPGLLAAGAAYLSSFSNRWSRISPILGVILCVMATALYAVELRRPMLLPATSFPIQRFHGWSEQARALAQFKDHYVIASHYQIASQLAYYGGFHRFSPTFGRASQFNIWNDKPENPESQCLVVSLRPLTAIESRNLKVKPSSAKTLNAFFGDKRIRRLWLYLTDGAPDMERTTTLSRWVDRH